MSRWKKVHTKLTVSCAQCSRTIKAGALVWRYFGDEVCSTTCAASSDNDARQEDADREMLGDDAGLVFDTGNK